MPPLAAKSTIGQPFIELSEVGSTNIYAMERVQANLAAHGTSFFAHNQTAGKGQRGKSWIVEPGTHIALSVIVDCSFLSLSNPFPISVMAAVACHDFFSRYAPSETYIKWPNDLYWRDRKAGGILIENQVRGNIWQWGVVGIGINLNQAGFPDSLLNPVSLKQITGRPFNTVEMAKELCSDLEKRYQQLKHGGDEDLLTEYTHHLFMCGQEVRLKKNNMAFPCFIKGVSAGGELLVSGCMQDSFRFGEVEWVGNIEY